MRREEQRRPIELPIERGINRFGGCDDDDRSGGWRGVQLAVVFVCISVATQSVQAGRPRPVDTPEPTSISSTILGTISRSAAELPINFQATDAESLTIAVEVANQIGCGVNIDVSGTITANIVLTPRCPDPDALGIRLRGPATLYGGIFAGCEGPDCAWASVEGLRVISNDEDAFDASHDGRLAVLDSEGEVDGLYSNVLTSHQNGRILALSSSGRSVSNEMSPVMAFIQNSRAIVAGSGEFRSGTAERDFVLLVGGSNPDSHPLVALIGHRLRCGREGQFSIGFEPGIGGHSELWWGNGIANCPIDLHRDWDESATMTTFGSGRPMPLPFPIPAWVDGHEYLEVEIDR